MDGSNTMEEVFVWENHPLHISKTTSKEEVRESSKAASSQMGSSLCKGLFPV